MKRPVTIYTIRNGQPYVLFGKHLDGNSLYGDSGKTFDEIIAEKGGAEVHGYQVEDGPDIEKWAAMFDAMEQAGVVMLID